MSFHRNKPCAHIDCVSEAHTHILRLREPAPFFACWLLLFLEMTPGTSFTTRLVCVRFRGLFHTCTARRECEYVGGDFFDESTNPSLIKCDLLGPPTLLTTMLAVLARVFKPVVVVWFGLQAIDDLTMIFRAARLASVVLPGGDKSELCSVCDDVMGDLLSGTDGIEAMPCNWPCLKIPSCVQMCERVKASAANSTHFPCIAAGYCDAVEEGEVDADVECKVGPFFRCTPSRYCKAVRSGLQMSCRLKPGIGRWVGMQNSLGAHAGLLAQGLLSQPHCGEPNAGPYCIATPTGLGAVAEAVGHALSIGYGTVRTISGIETPGGDDDRQWLTFWLILTILLFVERFLARVLLSTLPLYYELKLALLCWLMLAGGADTVYRKLRRLLIVRFGNRIVTTEDDQDKDQLGLLRSEIPEIVEASQAAPAGETSAPKADTAVADCEDQDWEELKRTDDASSESLRKVSTFLLSARGASMLEESPLSVSQKALLVQSAAAEISFQPRFLYVRLVGTAKESLDAELPAMDTNGRADAYVKCRLVPASGVPYPKRGVMSRTIYRTTAPQWNEELELALVGGSVRCDGTYENRSAAKAEVLFQVFDADVGVWGWLYIALRLSLFAMLVGAASAYITGYDDKMSRAQVMVAKAVGITATVLTMASYVYSRLLRTQDQLIGEAKVCATSGLVPRPTSPGLWLRLTWLDVA